MLKVNEEKIIADYKELQEKKGANLANIEAKVRSFALQLDYDEEKTKGLIGYVQKQNGNGLYAEESAKLEILSSYIEEVEEVIEKADTESEVVGVSPEVSVAFQWQNGEKIS